MNKKENVNQGCGAFLEAQTIKNLLATQETRFDPWVGERNGYPLLLPGEFHGQRSLVGYRLKVDMKMSAMAFISIIQ